MLKNIIKIVLVAGLSVASLNADTFKKGDTVLVEKGNFLCFHKDSVYALDGLTRLDIALEMYRWAIEDAVEDNKKLPRTRFNKIKIGKLSANFCAVYNHDVEYKFNSYYSKGEYALLDSKNYWVGSYVSSLKKGVNKPKVNTPNYSFLGIDDLEAFPSDYIGKLSFLKCKRSTPEEMKGGGYKIMSTCAKSDGRYGFGGNNPFKIQIQTSSKDTARAIAKSKKQEKWFLGTVKKNPEKYGIAKNIFVINEVQYK